MSDERAVDVAEEISDEVVEIRISRSQAGRIVAMFRFFDFKEEHLLADAIERVLKLDVPSVTLTNNVVQFKVSLRREDG